MSILDPLAYPAPRADRSPSSSFVPTPTAPGGTSIPRTRTFAFRFANLLANSRTTRSFGPFTGPAVLRRLQWDINTGVANGVATLGLGTSPTRITEDIVPITTAKGWTPLIEHQDVDAFVTPAEHEGFYQESEAPTHGLKRGDLNILINVPTFFLTITIYTGGAGFRWVGDGTIIEGLSEEALRNFL